MKTFLFKGEMAELFGSEVSLDVLTMREALMALFAIKKGFKILSSQAKLGSQLCFYRQQG